MGAVGEAAHGLSDTQTALYFLMVMCVALMIVVIALVVANGRISKAMEKLTRALWALRLELAQDKSAAIQSEDLP